MNLKTATSLSLLLMLSGCASMFELPNNPPDLIQPDKIKYKNTNAATFSELLSDGQTCFKNKLLDAKQHPNKKNIINEYIELYKETLPHYSKTSPNMEAVLRNSKKYARSLNKAKVFELQNLDFNATEGWVIIREETNNDLDGTIPVTYCNYVMRIPFSISQLEKSRKFVRDLEQDHRYLSKKSGYWPSSGRANLVRHGVGVAGKTLDPLDKLQSIIYYSQLDDLDEKEPSFFEMMDAIDKIDISQYQAEDIKDPALNKEFRLAKKAFDYNVDSDDDFGAIYGWMDKSKLRKYPDSPYGKRWRFETLEVHGTNGLFEYRTGSPKGDFVEISVRFMSPLYEK